MGLGEGGGMSDENKPSKAALDAAWAIWQTEANYGVYTQQGVVEMARKIDAAFAKEKKP